MKKIGAAKFREQSLSLQDNLSAEGLVITKHGKPVALVTPVGAAPTDLIGSLKGKIKVKGDLFSTETKWKAGMVLYPPK